MRAKEMAAAATFGRSSPSERARAVGELLWSSKLGNGSAAKDALVCVNATIQQHLAEASKVGSGAEDSGVARDAANRCGILVVNFALNQAMPVLVVDFRRGDCR